MQTYRHDTAREDLRRRLLKRHEALVEARRRFAESCSALSYGKSLDPSALWAPGSFLYRLIFARRIARTAAAAAVIAAAAALGGIAILSPGLPAALLPLTWLAGPLLYAAVEALIVRVDARRSQGALAPAACADVLRAKAHGLEIASAVLPAAGFLLTVIFPLSWWMFTRSGSGALFIALAAVSYGFFAWVRASVNTERAQLNCR